MIPQIWMSEWRGAVTCANVHWDQRLHLVHSVRTVWSFGSVVRRIQPGAQRSLFKYPRPANFGLEHHASIYSEGCNGGGITPTRSQSLGPHRLHRNVRSSAEPSGGWTKHRSTRSACPGPHQFMREVAGGVAHRDHAIAELYRQVCGRRDAGVASSPTTITRVILLSFLFQLKIQVGVGEAALSPMLLGALTQLFCVCGIIHVETVCQTPSPRCR
jgi:hypothetical protein